MKVSSKSSDQTKKAGQLFAKKILKFPLTDKALIFGLKGDLGTGKTTFLQGFAKGMKIKEKILSPTFVLMRKFQIPKISSALKFKTFYHIDCFRFNNPKEILDLGFKEIISNPQNIVAIEWADRIKKFLPDQTIWLEFEIKND